MSVKRLLERVPVDRDAEDRAWAVVRSAFEEREAVRRVPRRRWALAAVALVVAVAAAALSPPGRAVVDAVRRSIGIDHAAPALFRLPVAGRLLVSGDGGTWIVSTDGSRRRLGGYTQASWSPHGLYVVAAAGDSLAAVEPATGDVRWALARPDVVLPRWGGSRVDTRVAYLSRGRLHVVGGDGVRDSVVGRAAHVAPAWRPGDRLQLAYVTAVGRVRLVGAWTSRRAYSRPRSLVWSRDGRRLLLVTARSLVLFDPRSGRPVERSLAGVQAAAFSPDGRLAVVRGNAVLLLDGERTRTLLTAPGRLAGVVWSPDGRWLLTSLPGADQWVFVGGRHVLAVSHISAQLGGAVELDGWMPGA